MDLILYVLILPATTSIREILHALKASTSEAGFKLFMNWLLLSTILRMATLIALTRTPIIEER
jgi:hypothetical protein